MWLRACCSKYDSSAHMCWKMLKKKMCQANGNDFFFFSFLSLCCSSCWWKVLQLITTMYSYNSLYAFVSFVSTGEYVMLQSRLSTQFRISRPNAPKQRAQREKHIDYDELEEKVNHTTVSHARLYLLDIVCGAALHHLRDLSWGGRQMHAQPHTYIYLQNRQQRMPFFTFFYWVTYITYFTVVPFILPICIFVLAHRTELTIFAKSK